MLDADIPALAALHRLIRLVRDAVPPDLDDARRVADFLLAWWDAEGSGGWDPQQLARRFCQRSCQSGFFRRAAEADRLLPI